MQGHIVILEETRIVQPANSEWGSPVVVAPKQGTKPGTFAPRFCNDYRELNDLTVDDTYPLPRIDEILG